MTTITSNPISGEQTTRVQPKTTRWPWLMLFSRIAMFFGVQVVFAAGFLLAGAKQPWANSIAWWPLVVAVANGVCLAFLVKIFRTEGNRFWNLFRFDRSHIKGDLLALLVLTALMAPISYLPNVMLGQWLFGNPEATLSLFVRPLPFWVVYASIILFPISQGVVELPTYFGYVMPRFKALGMHKWLTISLPAILLGLQHMAAPLVFDIRFIAWRGLMFIPFAFLTAIGLHWRPRLLPYFVIIHILMNMSFMTMFLDAAY